jgi:hypothetical protein
MKRDILKDSWGTWQSVLRQISQKQDIFIPLLWHPVSSCIYVFHWPASYYKKYIFTFFRACHQKTYIA